MSVNTFEGVSQVLAVSGSASPLSAIQIQMALDAGFKELRVDASALVTGDGKNIEFERLTYSALDALHKGESVMVHTAMGPSDLRINQMVSALASNESMSTESARHEGGRRLGQQLGEWGADVCAVHHQHHRGRQQHPRS